MSNRSRSVPCFLARTFAVAMLWPVYAAATTFSNTSSIALNDPNSQSNGNNNATATPYPSNITVSGLSGTISHLSVTLSNVSYAFSGDIDALLVGPAGRSLIVIAAVGPNTGSSEAASNSTLTLDDSGTLPTDLTPWGSSSTFKPANFGSYGLGGMVNGFNEVYESPAPAAPWGDPGQHGSNATLGNTFDGTNPNGTWSLYILTTSAGDGTGTVAGGWSLNITMPSAVPTTTSISSNDNPSFATAPGNSVLFTATVSSSTTVSEGTVTFTANGLTIPGCGAAPVNSAGQATCMTSFATQGSYTAQAQYNGDANFAASNGSLTQVVNNHTVITGSNYCNTGSITLNNPPAMAANATPYPSEVFVAGLPGTTKHVAVTLNNATYSFSQDIDALLVAPDGESLILVAAAGPNSNGAISNVTLTLDDDAASTIASNAVWGAANSSVTSKPVNYGGFNETWSSPAPTGPYGNPGPLNSGTATFNSVFNGISANGTWSLYVITTAAGAGTGSIDGGWCLDVTAPSPPTLAESLGASSIPVGNSTSLTFTISNPNASTSLTGIGFSDTLPSGLAISTPNGLTSTCNGTVTATQGTIVVDMAGVSLAANSSCGFSVNVTGTGAGAQSNTTGNITSNETNSGGTATASLTVNPATSGTALTTSCPLTFVANQAFAMTATVSGYGPTGTSTFADDGVGISGCAAIALNAGIASCSTSILPMGTDTLSAAYGGDTNNKPSNSATLSVMVLDPADVIFRNGFDAIISGCPTE